MLMFDEAASPDYGKWDDHTELDWRFLSGGFMKTEKRRPEQGVYVTFGQAHRHTLPTGEVFDRNCVAHCDSRAHAFELFGNKFCVEYSWEAFDLNWLSIYYPRGIIEAPLQAEPPA